MPFAPRHVCAEAGCSRLVDRGRCAVHVRVASRPAVRSARAEASRNHHGISPSRRGHGADYQHVRVTLIGRPCHWCDAPATTADYAVPWSQGGTLADLVPACSRCNYARGARIRGGGMGGSKLRAPEAVPQLDRRVFARPGFAKQITRVRELLEDAETPTKGTPA